MANYITPITDIAIVFDDEDSNITQQVNDIDVVLNLFDIEVKLVKATEYDEQNDENVKAIVYLVSLETEQFHKTVKRKLVSNSKKQRINLENSESCRRLVVLKHSKDDAKFVNKLIKDVHKKANSKNGTKDAKGILEKAATPLVCVLEWSNVAAWWPMVLYFIQGLHKAELTNTKEIGVFFHINPDLDAQMQWFSEQRKTLEEHFQIKCAYGGRNTDNDKCIRNSSCVVIYVREDSLKRRRDTLLSTEQQSTLACVKSESCTLRVFVDKYEDGGEKYNKTFLKKYDLVMMGDGMLTHWVGLMNDLGLIKVHRKPDLLFYSSVKDNNYPVHFKPKENKMLPERAMTSMTSRSGYQGDMDLDDINPDSVNGLGGSVYLGNAIHHICYQLAGTRTFVTEHTSAHTRNICCAFYPFTRRL